MANEDIPAVPAVPVTPGNQTSEYKVAKSADNLQGNQLLPGVLLSSADGAAGGTMVVSILDQVATSVDILRSSFGEPIYKAAAPQFSRDQLETARKVLSSFKAEALKDYERQLEEHRQAEAWRARESLVRDAFSK